MGFKVVLNLHYYSSSKEGHGLNFKGDCVGKHNSSKRRVFFNDEDTW